MLAHICRVCYSLQHTFPFTISDKLSWRIGMRLGSCPYAQSPGAQGAGEPQPSQASPAEVTAPTLEPTSAWPCLLPAQK